jgi:hypothetical protein
VIYIVAFEVYDGAAKQRDRGLLPHQVLFTDLPPSEQRIFPDVCEGSTRRWSSTARAVNGPAWRASPTASAPCRRFLDRSRLRWTVGALGRPPATSASR